MTGKAFDKIAAGLTDAIAIVRGKADPATYRVHDRPSRARPSVAITFRLTEDEIAVVDDVMREGKWPNRTVLIKSWVQGIIHDEAIAAGK